MIRHALRSTILAVALATVACAHPARVAPFSIITDRPDFTESAQTVPAGFTQVEMGGTYSREESVKSISTGETLVRVGMSPKVELRLTAASYAVETADAARAQGMEDTGLGFKFALHEGPEGPSIVPTVALIAGTSLPTGAQAFRSQRALPEAKLLGAWTISERVGFASNLNWARAEAAGTTHDEFSASGSFAFSLSDKVGAYTEAYSFAERFGGWQRRTYVNGGLTYLFNEGFQVDARAGVRTDKVGGVFFGLGLARRF